MIVLVVGGVAALAFVGVVCALFIMGIALAAGWTPGRTATTAVAAPAPSGWPMEFQRVDDKDTITGPVTPTFDERRADGSEQRISVTVHAPSPFLASGISGFTFEVCKLQNGERSAFRCSSEEGYVNPAKVSQKDAYRTFIIRSGPGTYEARVVEYGTWGADDKVHSSATFEVR